MVSAPIVRRDSIQSCMKIVENGGARAPERQDERICSAWLSVNPKKQPAHRQVAIRPMSEARRER